MELHTQVVSRAFDIQNKKNLRNIQFAFAVRVHSWLSNLNFFCRLFLVLLNFARFLVLDLAKFSGLLYMYAGIRTVEHTHIFPIYKQTKLSIIIIKKNAPI